MTPKIFRASGRKAARGISFDAAKPERMGIAPGGFPPANTTREAPRDRAERDPRYFKGRTDRRRRQDEQRPTLWKPKDQSRGQPETPKRRADRRDRQDQDARKLTSWSPKNPNRGESGNDPDPKNEYFHPLDFPSKTYGVWTH